MPHMKKGSSVSRFQIEVDNNNTVFSSTSRFMFAYYMHYPKQLMRSTPIERDNLRITAPTFSKQFSIDNMEVIRRRNTRDTPCLLDESYKDDDLIRHRLVEKTGCRPSHWPDNDNYPKCTTFDQMSQVITPDMQNNDPEFLREFEDNPGSPCNQILSIAYTRKHLFDKPKKEDTTAEKKDDPASNPSHLTNGGMVEPNPPVKPSFEQNGDTGKSPGAPPPGPLPKFPSHGRQPLDAPPTVPKEEKLLGNNDHIIRKRSLGPLPGQDLTFPATRIFEIIFKNANYKEIKHVQSFNFETFLGNVGGYVGLFIGVAIWQAPELIEFFFKKLMRR